MIDKYLWISSRALSAWVEMIHSQALGIVEHWCKGNGEQSQGRTWNTDQNLRKCSSSKILCYLLLLKM